MVLPHERQRTQESLECSPFSCGPDTDRHDLSGVLSFAFHDRDVLYRPCFQIDNEIGKLFFCGVERDGVGATREVAGRRFTGRVNEVRSLETDREVGSNDAVVNEGGCRYGLTVNAKRSSSCPNPNHLFEECQVAQRVTRNRSKKPHDDLRRSLRTMSAQYEGLVLQASREVHGVEATIVSNYNGQPYGRSRKSWKGRKIKFSGASLDFDGHVWLSIESYLDHTGTWRLVDMCLSSIRLDEVQFDGE